MPARPPSSGDGTRPIPRPPDRNTASAYEYVTGRSNPAALSDTRQPRGDPMASSPRLLLSMDSGTPDGAERNPERPYRGRGWSSSSAESAPTRDALPLLPASGVRGNGEALAAQSARDL